MNGNFEIPQSVIDAAIEKTLAKGELGDKVADRLAAIYAEITTYNRTDAAKLLNIARSTLHEYEKEQKIKFRDDGRISVAELHEFQKSLAAAGDADDGATTTRKSKKQKRRQF